MKVARLARRALLWLASPLETMAAASETDESRRQAGWARRAHAIVKAVKHHDDPAALAELSKNLGEAMVGIGMESLAEDQLLARRGW